MDMRTVCKISLYTVYSFKIIVNVRNGTNGSLPVQSNVSVIVVSPSLPS